MLCLLLLSCLLSRPASSQPSPSLQERGLGGGVFRLDSGTVASRPLIGLDPATYATTRQYVSTAQQLLAVRAERVVQLERATHLADSLSLVVSAELRRCRQQAAASEAEFQVLAAQARQAVAQPVRPPLLLDGHFYKGCGVGAVALVVLRLLVH